MVKDKTIIVIIKNEVLKYIFFILYFLLVILSSAVPGCNHFILNSAIKYAFFLLFGSEQ